VYSHSIVVRRALACVLAATAVTSAAGPDTLAGLLEMAARENRELQAARQNVEAAKGALRQAGVRPAPELEVNGASGKPLGSSGEHEFSVGVAQTIETGGKRSRRVEIARRELDAAEAEYAERLRQLRFELASRYADFAAETERQRAFERLIEINRRALELMRARVDRGDAAALDANLLQVELSRAEAQREAALGRQGAARADMARLAGIEESALDGLRAAETQKQLPEEAELRARALRVRPDLLVLRHIEQRGEMETALTMAEAKPNVTVSAGYSRSYSRFDYYGYDEPGLRVPLKDTDNTLALGVKIPLYGSGRNRGNLDASVARTRAARLRREYLERSIPLEVTAAMRRWRQSLKVLATLDGAAVEQAEKNVAVIRGAYELGNLRLIDVLNEQRRLLDTQLAAIDARADVLRGYFELERAVGERVP